MCDYNDDFRWRDPHDYLSTKKLTAPPDKHIPNKNEAKLLRKLMSQTGLSEKELREHKVYRKMLSKEQKKKGDTSKTQKLFNSILKQVLRELKLPKEHPDVLIRFNEIFKERKNKIDYNRYSYYGCIFVSDKISKVQFDYLSKKYKKKK